LGHDPTPVEVRDWLIVPEAAQWMDLPTIEDKLANPWYRTYLAKYDPFFEENIKPFNPGIPVLNAAPGQGPVERLAWEGATKPILDTLTSWGWEVYNYYDPTYPYFTDTQTGPGHTFAVNKILEILYPDGVPPELAP